MKSITFANSDTSDMGWPSAPTKGVKVTAAEIFRPLPTLVAFSCCSIAKKFAESSGETWFAVLPCFPGYSQLIDLLSDDSPNNINPNLLEVNAVQIILLHKSHNGVHESSPAASCRHTWGEILRARPATQRQECLDIL